MMHMTHTIRLTRGIAMMAFATSMVLMAQTSKPAGKVILKTDAVSVVETSDIAEKCPDKKGTTVRLRVSGASSVDVVVRYKLEKTPIERPFRNQAPGSEFSVYQCRPKAQFEVFSVASDSLGKGASLSNFAE